MSEVAIRAEGLTGIGERGRYNALRDMMTRTLRAPWKAFQDKPREPNQL